MKKGTLKQKIVAVLGTIGMTFMPIAMVGCDLFGDKNLDDNTHISGDQTQDGDKTQDGELKIEEDKVYTPDTPEFQQELKKLKDKFEDIVKDNDFTIMQNHPEYEDNHEIQAVRFWHYQNEIIELKYINHIHDGCCYDDDHKFYYRENDVDYVLKPIVGETRWEKHYSDIDAFDLINKLKFEESDLLSYKNGYFKLSNEKNKDVELTLNTQNSKYQYIDLYFNDLKESLRLLEPDKNEKIELPTDIIDFTASINSAEFQQNLKQFINKVLDERNFTVYVSSPDDEDYGFYLYFDGKKSKYLNHSRYYQEYYFEDEDIFIENDIDQVMQYFLTDEIWKKDNDKMRYESRVLNEVVEFLKVFKDFELTDEDYDRYTDTYTTQINSKELDTNVKFEIQFTGNKLNLKLKGYGIGNLVYDIYDVGNTKVELPKYYYDWTTNEYVGEPEEKEQESAENLTAKAKFTKTKGIEPNFVEQMGAETKGVEANEENAEKYKLTDKTNDQSDIVEIELADVDLDKEDAKARILDALKTGDIERYRHPERFQVKGLDKLGVDKNLFNAMKNNAALNNKQKNQKNNRLDK